MSKAVLISIRPKWCEKIADGGKTIEVRRTRPKLETPFKVYIYCTAGNLQYETQNGMFCRMSGGREVIGEFICDKIYEVAPRWKEYIVLGENKGTTNEIARASCLSFDNMKAYLGEANGYGWHISKLEIYDHPKKLEDFNGLCRMKVPCDRCPYYNYQLSKCGYRQVRRAPQSWQYVEELK